MLGLENKTSIKPLQWQKMMCPVNFCDIKRFGGSLSSNILYAHAGLRVWDHAESTNGDLRFSALNQNKAWNAVKNNQNPRKRNKLGLHSTLTHSVSQAHSQIRVRCSFRSYFWFFGWLVFFFWLGLQLLHPTGSTFKCSHAIAVSHDRCSFRSVFPACAYLPSSFLHLESAASLGA